MCRLRPGLLGARLGVVVSIAWAVLAACHGETGSAGVWILYNPCDDVVIDVGDDATSAELSSIDEALAMWAAVGLGTLTREPLPGAQRIPLWFDEAAPFFYGVYQPAIGDVVINRALSNQRDRSITIAHELGHAFGLLHVDGDMRRSVMNAGNLTVAPTAEDVAALARYWGRCPD